MLVFFVRHGQSEGNKKLCIQKDEVGLSEKGLHQAGLLAGRLKNTHFDVIYSSDKKRALQTADIIAKKLKTDFKEMSDLAEFRYISHLKGRSIHDAEILKVNDLYRKNLGNPHWKYKDEESYVEFIGRVDGVRKKLEKMQNMEKILCISHCRFITTFVANFVFKDRLSPILLNDFTNSFYLRNASITVCKYTREREWKLLVWGDQGHLL